MSRDVSPIECPKCGTKLSDYERRRRSVWQWALFHKSRKYQCEHCGKKTFIFNYHTYLAKQETSTTQNQIEDLPIGNETISGQRTETKAKPIPEGIPDHRKARIPSTSIAKESDHTPQNTPLEKTFISGINTYLNIPIPSIKIFIDEQQMLRSNTVQEDPPETTTSRPGKITSNCQEVHARLKLPNHFIQYRNTTTVEDEIEEAKKVYLELQESFHWSMSNFHKSQHLKLGLIRESVRQLIESMLRNPDAIFLLSRLKGTDTFIYEHCINTSILAVLFGRHMGLTVQELDTLALGALLLDIGKSKLPKALLEKPTKLTAAEIKLIQKHVQFSLDIINTTDIDKEILNIVGNHHKRLDGQGYPKHQFDANVSVFAKMASIADAYDAMTHVRPYRKALPAQKAIDILHQQRSQQFHAELVDEFTHCIGAYPTGSMVILNTGQAGIVISQNETHYLQPRVLIVSDSTNRNNTVITPFTCDLEKESLGENGKPVFIKAAA